MFLCGRGVCPLPRVPVCPNAGRVDRTYKLYYGGAQKRPDSMSSRAVLDHAGRTLAYVADGGIKDLRNAVEAAHKAAPA